MTESETAEKLRAYHKCQRLQVKGNRDSEERWKERVSQITKKYML